MTDLLFLCQRIPYPPDKGEKIRAFHILEHLRRRHRIHLGCLIDDPADWQHVDAVRALCAGSHFARLDPLRAKLRCLTALPGSAPLSVPYFHSSALARWVRTTLDQVRPAAGLLYSSTMAQYLMGHGAFRPDRLVMDFVDVDSDKWRQYAPTRRWPMGAVYRRESRTLLAFDRRVARLTDASIFVSEAEAALFRSLAPESAVKVAAVGNGIDATFFAPDRAAARPVEADRIGWDRLDGSLLGGPLLVFTGTMDYWPNVDAVTWFADHILPRIRARRPDAVFCIVGTSPAPPVSALADRPGIIVTGRVADVRPYLARADVAVAPIRIARGIQNKVLEAMAMARPTVVTPEALEGIEASPGHDLVLAGDGSGDAAEAFADAVLGVLDNAGAAAIGRAARCRVLDHYSWPAQLAPLDALIAG